MSISPGASHGQYGYSHPPSESSVSPEGHDKAGTQPHTQPESFPSLNTPFASSLAPLQSAPLTPWSYQPTYAYAQPAHYIAHDRPEGMVLPPDNQQWLAPVPADQSGDHWAMSQRPMSEGMPPPPPNSAAVPIDTPLWPAYPSEFGGYAPSPTSQPYTSHGYEHDIPRPGPMRGWSFSGSSSRRRSNTLTYSSGTSASPGTPHSSTVGAYPYPSPGIVRRPTMQFSPLGSTTAPTSSRRVYHPSPSAASPSFQLDQLHYTDDYSVPRVSHPRQAGHDTQREETMTLAEPKPPRFKPTKEQLEILIGSYNKNKWVLPA